MMKKEIVRKILNENFNIKTRGFIYPSIHLKIIKIKTKFIGKLQP